MRIALLLCFFAAAYGSIIADVEEESSEEDPKVNNDEAEIVRLPRQVDYVPDEVKTADNSINEKDLQQNYAGRTAGGEIDHHNGYMPYHPNSQMHSFSGPMHGHGMRPPSYMPHSHMYGRSADNYNPAGQSENMANYYAPSYSRAAENYAQGLYQENVMPYYYSPYSRAADNYSPMASYSNQYYAPMYGRAAPPPSYNYMYNNGQRQAKLAHLFHAPEKQNCPHIHEEKHEPIYIEKPIIKEPIHVIYEKPYYKEPQIIYEKPKELCPNYYNGHLHGRSSSVLGFPGYSLPSFPPNPYDSPAHLASAIDPVYLM